MLLTACATPPAPEPVVITKTVSVPIAVACHPDLGQPPAFPDTDAALKAAPNLYERVRLLVAGRLLRIGWEAELSAAIEACSK